MLEAYHSQPWLNAATTRVSTSVASNPWRLYRAKGGSGQRGRDARKYLGRRVRTGKTGERTKAIARLKAEGEIEEVEEHRVLDLLYGGNEFMTGSTVRQLTQIYMDVGGEAFLLTERDGAGKPRELLPIPRTWITQIATPDDPNFEISRDGYREKFPASEMVYFQAPNLIDPYGRGVGTAKALDDELATDEYAAKHTRKWFENSARPDILVFGKGLDKDETRRLESKWRAKFQGVKNAFQPSFLSAEVKIHELNQTFESMQLKELREFERDTIIQVYGIPPEILGIIANSNRATIEAADYLYGRWVILPRVEYTCEVLQVRLLDREFAEDGLILGYDSPVAEDKEHQKQIMQNHPWSFMIDEIREAAGLEPLENGAGRVFMMPFNLVPQESPALVPSAPPQPDPDPEEEPDEEPVEDVVEEESVRDIGRGYRKADEDEPTLSEEDVTLIVATLSAEGLIEGLTPALRDALEAFGEGAIEEVDGGEFEVSPRITNYLNVTAAGKIRDMTETTRSALREELIEGVRAGEGIPKLKRRVEGVFEEARGWRATNIARTEVVGASNFGAWEGYRQGGVPGKSWLSTRDSRSRDAHASIDGQRRGLEEDFENDLGTGPCPGQMSGGASNNVNCRCAITPLVDLEQDDFSEEIKAAMWRALDRERMPHERRVKQVVRGEFAKQQAQILGLVQEMARERVTVQNGVQ